MAQARLRYRKVHTCIWADAKFRSLSPLLPSGQALWFHMLFGQQTGLIPGLFTIGERAFAEQIGWKLWSFRKACRELTQSSTIKTDPILDLSDTGPGPKQGPSFNGDAKDLAQNSGHAQGVTQRSMVKTDWVNSLVWIPQALKYNPPSSPSVVTGWRNEWNELPECALKLEAWQHFTDWFTACGRAWLTAWETACKRPQPIGQPVGCKRPQPVGQPVGQPPRHQEQEQEQEQEVTPPPLLIDFGKVIFPAGLDTPGVRQSILDWLRYKQFKHQPYKNPARSMSLKLKEFVTAEDFIAGEQASEGSGYDGLFPSKGGSQQKGVHDGARYDPGRRVEAL